MVSVKFSKLAFLLVFSLSTKVKCEKISDSFQTCPTTAPNFNECLSSAIENAVKLLKSGSEVFQILPIDPFERKSMKIAAGSAAVHMRQNYKNLVITGFGDLKINDTKWDKTKMILSFTSNHPKIEQVGDYELNGRILILPVFGKGDSRISLENVSLHHTIQFENALENFYSVASYTVSMSPRRVRYHFNNLFNGNAFLGDAINRLINTEWAIVYADVRKGYEQYYSAFFKEWQQNICDKVPQKDLFPD